MSQEFQWDREFFSLDTSEFDRALSHLRGTSAPSPVALASLATVLKNTPGITRREFDRRFRLIVAACLDQDPAAIRSIATQLGESAPEALNSVRTLLPAELRHLAIPLQTRSEATAAAAPLWEVPASDVRVFDSPERLPESKHRAVVLIGTAEEHVRNDGMIHSAELNPLRLPSLDHLWNIAPTGLCGFVVGASAWGPVPRSEQRRAVRRLCEYSTFIFARVCLNGMVADIAEKFIEDATAARCGMLDARKFCHGQDCDLTPADIRVLRSIARLLEKAGQTGFFPLGLSEPEASLLRLIAAERHPADEPVTIQKLETRELPGGRSTARVFLLSDGRAQPFVAKVDDSEHLVEELGRYRRWIQPWELIGTNPTFHAHQGSAAISYRLQAAPDSTGHPAPTLEDCLEGLRNAEWSCDLPMAREKSSDLFQGISRAVDQLETLNRQSTATSEPDNFWLAWPIEQLAEKGIDITIVDCDWKPRQLSAIVTQAMERLKPHLTRSVVHGDVHGRNVLLLDRLATFIDFRWSGPGHPLVDLVRLDAAVRTIAMRMILPKQSMHQAFCALYVDGQSAEQLLTDHAALAASPLTSLAVRVAVRTRLIALAVAQVHGLGIQDYYAMTCVVSAHVLSVRAPGSGIERLLLSVLAPHL